MLWILYTILTLLVSCGGGSSSHSGTSTPKQTTQKVPDNKTNTSSSTKTSSGGDTGNSGTTDDFRLDASTSYKQPSLDKTIDPRTFSPSGSYTLEQGKRTFDPLTSSIAVFDDGRSYNLPACEHAFPPPSIDANLSLKLNGDLSGWPVSTLVGIDQTGDSPNGQDGLDVREVYFNQDAKYYYFAVKMGNAWDQQSEADNGLIFTFSALTIPTKDTDLPDASAVKTYGVFGSQFLQESGNQFTSPASSVDYQMVINDGILQFKLNRTEIDSGLKNKPLVFSAETYVGDTQKRDQVGMHILGLVDDYACLVPIPDAKKDFTKFKMVVLRRADSSIDPKIAESAYRAIIAAIPADTVASADNFKTWDTLSFTVLTTMSAAGLFVSNAGIFIEANLSNFVGEKNTNLQNYFVAAHEYLHGFNALDYNLPNHWMREGHSNWMATNSLETLFGKGVRQFSFYSDVLNFLTEESTTKNSNKVINESTWGASPNTLLYYYRKAATLYELLAQKFTYADFLENVLHKNATSSPFTDDSGFLKAITKLTSYTGHSNDDISSGWVTAAASSQSVPYASIQDVNGLFAYQRSALDLDATSIDQSRDGLADVFKFVFGLDLKKKNAYSYLAADNYLGDWEALHPEALKIQASSQNSTSPCGSFSNLSRYGVVYNEDWVLLAIETKEVAKSSDGLETVIFITDANGKTPQVIAQWGNNFYYIKDQNNKLIRPGMMLSNYSGKVLEIPINLAWMGWSAASIPKITFKIVTFANGNNQCDYTEDLTASSL